MDFAVGMRALVLAATFLGVLAGEAAAQQSGPGEPTERSEPSAGGGGRDGGGASGNSRVDRFYRGDDRPPPGPSVEVRVIEEAPPPRRLRRPESRRGETRRAAPQRRVARRAPPPPPAAAEGEDTAAVRAALPPARSDELVALGLDEGTLATLAGQGFTVRERFALATLGDIVRLGIPGGTTPDAARQSVLAAAPAAIVDLNAIYIPGAEACEGLACGQLRLVGWPVVEAGGRCGEGIVLGIVDTGINPSHPALAEADVTLLPVLGAAPRVSRESHGTAVAAVLVGAGDPRIRGLLPEARLVAADAFVEDASGRTHTDAFRLVAAIDTVAKEGPDALNLSLTGPANLVLEAAVNAVAEAGVVVVAAVGNDGPTSPPLYPAAYDAVVAVTAVDANRAIYRRAVQGDHVDFAAPGVDVWTAASVSGARPKTGTSFAAPFVAAALALARHNGAVDRGAAVDRLAAGVEDLGAPGRDTVFGWGLMGAGGLCGEETAFATASE